MREKAEKKTLKELQKAAELLIRTVVHVLQTLLSEPYTAELESLNWIKIVKLNSK